MARRKRRPLGQHFLTARPILERLVNAAGVQSGDWVVEIGPGRGHLTRVLLERGARVIAVELDASLVAHLEKTFLLQLQHTLFLEHANVLQVNWGALLERYGVEGPVSMVANIPYYITTPILENLIQERERFRVLVLTLQKEVAQRAAARPGTRAFGSLSVFLQYSFDVTYLFTIPRRFFRPPPRVDSAALRLIPRATPRVQVQDERIFFRLVHGIFQQRRKMLRNVLRTTFPELPIDGDTLGGVSLQVRGETLDFETLGRLADAVAERLR